MEASSLKDSDLKKGRLIWSTPYAKKQYYLGNPSKDVNPNAKKMWAHVAASRHKGEWLKTVQKIINKEV